MSNVLGARNVQAEQCLVSSFKEMVVKYKEGRSVRIRRVNVYKVLRSEPGPQ